MKERKIKAHAQKKNHIYNNNNNNKRRRCQPSMHALLSYRLQQKRRRGHWSFSSYFFSLYDARGCRGGRGGVMICSTTLRYDARCRPQCVKRGANTLLLLMLLLLHSNYKNQFLNFFQLHSVQRQHNHFGSFVFLWRHKVINKWKTGKKYVKSLMVYQCCKQTNIDRNGFKTRIIIWFSL